jgi:hypothetical protein
MNQTNVQINDIQLGYQKKINQFLISQYKRKLIRQWEAINPATCKCQLGNTPLREHPSINQVICGIEPLYTWQ